jgi:hypothetical protein
MTINAAEKVIRRSLDRKAHSIIEQVAEAPTGGDGSSAGQAG